jgi:hypothetical protein
MLLVGQVFAEVVRNYAVVLVDATLHVGLTAAGEQGKGRCGDERCGNVQGTLHEGAETESISPRGEQEELKSDESALMQTVEEMGGGMIAKFMVSAALG